MEHVPAARFSVRPATRPQPAAKDAGCRGAPQPHTSTRTADSEGSCGRARLTVSTNVAIVRSHCSSGDVVRQMRCGCAARVQADHHPGLLCVFIGAFRAKAAHHCMEHANGRRHNALHIPSRHACCERPADQRDILCRRDAIFHNCERIFLNFLSPSGTPHNTSLTTQPAPGVP